jgi:ABC-2 type transport system permease protein
MSAVAVTPAPARVVSKPITLGRSIRAEVVKFTTLRSTVVVLAVALVALPVVAMIVAHNTRHATPTIDPNDLVASAPLQGWYLGQLLIGALGVLFVTGEYSTGQIRATMHAVPRRTPVLWAKLSVLLGMTLVPLVAMSVVAFVAAEAYISRYRPGYSLSDPSAARVVIGTGVYLALIGVLGMMIGWLVRSTPGALVTFIATILVMPLLFGQVLGTWGKHVAEVLPAQAGSAFITIIPDGYSLRPWPGIAVMMAWLVLFTAAALITLRHRDV